MTPRMKLALAALAIGGIAVAGGAQVGASRDRALQAELRTYGFDVDVSTLSTSDKARLRAALNDSDGHSEVMAKLRSILN